MALQKKFVKVELSTGDTPTKLSYGVDYTVSNNQILLIEAPAEGILIRIYRETPSNNIVDWENGSVLLASDMDLSQLQQLHLIEEASDALALGTIYLDTTTGAYQASGYRVGDVADPINPQDVVTKNYFETVHDGYVQEVEAIKKEAVDTTTQLKNDTLTLKNQTIESEGKTKSYMEQAQQEATEAEASETEATNQANLAKQYADSASASATASATSATSSETSKTEATNQANLAKQYAEEAKAQATASSNSASASATSASEAQTSADNASTSATNSANSASASATSASEAEASAELAKQYAESADITDVANMMPITVTAPTASAFTATFKTRSAYDTDSYTEYTHTLKTMKNSITAGDYGITVLLQKLIDYSHQHSYSNGSTTVTNCDCNCDCDNSNCH